MAYRQAALRLVRDEPPWEEIPEPSFPCLALDNPPEPTPPRVLTQEDLDEIDREIAAEMREELIEKGMVLVQRFSVHLTIISALSVPATFLACQALLIATRMGWL